MRLTDSSYIPALGRPELTGAYDRAVRLLTREREWRSAFVRQIRPQAGDAILDVGCGTGSLAILLKQAAPGARIVGLDPDPDVLQRAGAKAKAAGLDIEWRQGLAHDADKTGKSFDKAVSSLLFHQVPLAGKQAGIAAMQRAVRPGGELHIADYALQPSWSMRQLFRIIQLLDGRESTQPNAEGALEAILAEVDQAAAVPLQVIRTPTGAISLFRAQVAPAAKAGR